MDFLHRSHGSDTSLAPSRSQTPLLQQLYVTVTNWERVVASNALEFNKIKSLRKLRKSKKASSFNGDYSDVSSVDFSPKFSKSMKVINKRIAPKVPLSKSQSLGSVDKSSSSSDEDYDTIIPKSLSMNLVASRPVSCPPGTLIENFDYLIITVVSKTHSL